MSTRLMAFFAALWMTACGGLDKFEEVIVEEATIRIADGTPGAPFQPQYGSGFNGIDLAKSRTFANEGISPSDVDAITVKSVVLEMSTGANDPEIDRLDYYIGGMEMTVRADGQPMATFATLPTVPMAARADLTVPPGFDLKPYAVAPAMTVAASVQLKEPRGLVVKLKTTITLLVDVNVF